MRAVGAHVRAQRQRVQIVFKKSEIRPVRVVDKERNVASVADLAQSPYVLHAAQIVGRGYVYAEGLFAHGGELPLERLGRNGAGAGRKRPAFGIKPVYVEVLQRGGVDERLVGVSCGEAHRAAHFVPPVYQGDVQHRLYALSGALRGVERAPAAKEPRGVLFAFEYYAIRRIQLVRAQNFGYVVLVCARALVPRHMQARYAAFGIPRNKISYRRIHSSPSRLSATLTISAHSMRFLNSSQPYLYTPLIEPVAWQALAAQPPEQ